MTIFFELVVTSTGSPFSVPWSVNVKTYVPSGSSPAWSGSSPAWIQRLTQGLIVSPGRTAGLVTSHGDENGAHETAQRPAKAGAEDAGGGVNVAANPKGAPSTAAVTSMLETT